MPLDFQFSRVLEMSERELILNDLKPLFEQARKEGKWFWCHYQDLWFTPDELEKHHADGKFIWGAVNWELRDPEELINEARERVRSAREALQKTIERVHGEN